MMYSPNYKQCMIRVRGDLGKSFGNQWLLGVPFMQAYYTIHDMENKKIGLVRVNKTPDPKDKPAPVPEPAADTVADKPGLTEEQLKRKEEAEAKR